MTSTLTRNNNTITISDTVEIQQLRTIGDLSASPYVFSDTAGLLSSYVYNSGTDIHDFTLNSVGTGAETNSFISGANFTGPKYRAPLTYADGTAVLAGDAFSMSVIVENLTPGAVRQYCIALGVAQTPSSTVLGTMRGSGIYAITSAIGTPGVGGWEENIGTSTTVASMTKGIGACTFSGTPQKFRNGSSFGVMSATTGNVSSRLGGGTWNVADSAQLGLVVLAGTNGTVTATGGTLSLRIRYLIAKLG
jgi:hypothetical protein